MKKFIALGVLLLLCVGLLGRHVYLGALGPADPNDDSRHTVRVEEGMVSSQIAEMLEEKGIVNSAFAFNLYARKSGVAESFQAGMFVLRKSFTAKQIAEILQSGRGEEVIVTIPEGFTVTDIDTLLAEKGLSPPGSFLRCAQECDLSKYDFLPEDLSQFLDRAGQVEGYLYPDTYFVVATGFDEEAFINRLLTTFERKVIEGLDEYISTSERSLHELITMASLIEEEAITEEERPIISGILWKRFDAGVGLGVDATVRYLTKNPSGHITIKDLNENNPYNTRKLRGLPPSPIASPGYQSILASISPKTSPYWYYLHDPTGQIHYAETNNQHNLNRIDYLK